MAVVISRKVRYQRQVSIFFGEFAALGLSLGSVSTFVSAERMRGLWLQSWPFVQGAQESFDSVTTTASWQFILQFLMIFLGFPMLVVCGVSIAIAFLCQKGGTLQVRGLGLDDEPFIRIIFGLVWILLGLSVGYLTLQYWISRAENLLLMETGGANLLVDVRRWLVLLGGGAAATSGLLLLASLRSGRG
jgi:hypothetical protein